MIRANDDYWDSDRATYEDELGAWRERTAAAAAIAAPMTRAETHRSIRRPSRSARPRIWPKLRPGNVSGDRPRLAKRSRRAEGRSPRSCSAARPRWDPTDGGQTAANVLTTQIWPERERADRSSWVLQPAGHRSAVSWECRPKHRAMGLNTSAVRVAVGHDDPGRDRRRRATSRDPAPLDRNLDCESALSVYGTDELVDVGDVRLELDDEQHPTRGVPREDVDDPALADRSRMKPPARRSSPGGRGRTSRPSSCNPECRALSSRSRSPARQRGDQVDPNVEGLRDRPDRLERERRQCARVRALRSSSSTTPAILARSTWRKAAPEADRPEGAADPLVIHRPIVATPAYLALTRLSSQTCTGRTLAAIRSSWRARVRA